MVETSRNGAVVRITLNQPARANALSAQLVEALIKAVDDAIRTEARVLVLSGKGRTFCGGFDLSSLNDESDASLVYRFLRIERLLQTLHYAPCYTVALAHGSVSGAGADLVAACARRVVTPETAFRFPGARFGVVLGTGRLVRLVGSFARSLILEQRTVDAERALQIGLVDMIAQAADRDAIVAGVVKGALSVPPETVRQVMLLDQSAGDGDLGALARSIAEPGLKARMQAYWHEITEANRSALRAIEPETAS